MIQVVRWNMLLGENLFPMVGHETMIRKVFIAHLQDKGALSFSRLPYLKVKNLDQVKNKYHDTMSLAGHWPFHVFGQLASILWSCPWAISKHWFYNLKLHNKFSKAGVNAASFFYIFVTRIFKPKIFRSCLINWS